MNTPITQHFNVIISICPIQNGGGLGGMVLHTVYWQLVNHYKRRMFKHNLSLLTQTTSQNRAKLLEMVTYALKIVP